MLVLTRKPDQQILIGDNIKITVVRVKGNSVRIGIEAPTAVRVMRTELAQGQPSPVMQAIQAEVAPEAPPAAQPAPGKSAAQPAGHGGEIDDEQRRSPFAPQHGRTPGVSHASLIRRPQRLGPVVLRSMAGRM